MNQREIRRRANNKVSKIVAKSKKQKQPPITPELPVPQKIQGPSRLRFPSRKWWWIVGSSLVGMIWWLYLYAASWSLDPSSGSLRSHNPFFTVFTFTNAGVLPAQEVYITCIQRMIEYDSSKFGGSRPTFSAGLVPNSSTYSPLVQRNEKLSFVCRQVLSGLRFSRELVPLGAPAPVFTEDDEDLPIIWADFEFVIRYCPIPFLHVPFWTEHRRVIAQPSNDGTFVWAAATVGQKFDRPSYEKQPTRH